MITRLGEAWKAGWQVRIACAAGKGHAMKKHPMCTFATDLDMKTLMIAKGYNFPIDGLRDRLMCPECQACDMRVMYFPPGDNQREIDVTTKPKPRRWGTW
ncbi:hypothetical protein [Methylovirgula sp. 4M-Z18]|uniref:hypothetical protein n=1 Tax=Methylovirgula sp. 4M-Z18 TaxID=2293567 RepID=UPI000E2F5C40|nr:hypothetical protein [Methylovirgula sp. 4M-Z18]RFB80378.1 hypothetical protein DYH55_02300 [Methylovirgula sp. 4M-Z18]